MSPHASNQSHDGGVIKFIVGVVAGYLLKTLGDFVSGHFDSGENIEVIEHHGEEIEVEDVNVEAFSTTIVCIILLLIALTIGFETGKEYINESVNANFLPMIDSMFREMTILGFLSIITFLVTKFELVTELSAALFGESDALLEIFEFVHYTLFFILISFIVQVLYSAKHAMRTQRKWHRMDRVSRNGDYMLGLFKTSSKECIQQHINDAILSDSGYSIFNMRSKNSLHEQILFYCLREEFILDRDEETFHPCPVEKRVPADFNFGRYCSICLGGLLSRIVDIDNSTWYFFGLSTVVFYCFEIWLGYDMVSLAWAWCVLGYGFLLFFVVFEHHLSNIVRGFAGIEGTQLLSVLKEKDRQPVHVAVDEESYLTPINNGESEGLPKWCKVDMNNHVSNRSWFLRFVVGETTQNRQHSIYWFEHHGPKYFQNILQISLVFNGIYCALLAVVFAPTILETCGVYIFGLYVFIATFPIIVMVSNKHRLLALAALACCIGAHRIYTAINVVSREEKTSQLVRTLMVLFQLKRASKSKNKRRKSDIAYSESFDKLELLDVEKTFNLFDVSGDGQIDVSEIRNFFVKSGLDAHDADIERLISKLDVDGDGEVSKQEFMQWYTDYMAVDKVPTSEKAKFLFEMFDKDQSGYISIGEFKNALDGMNMGLSVEDITEIVAELDRDGDCMIGPEEFESLLDKYYPQELEKEHHMEMKKDVILKPGSTTWNRLKHGH